MTLRPPSDPDIRRARASLRIGPRVFAWGERTFVMGILNVTPDSFSGDGLLADGATNGVAAAVAAGRRMVADGADLLDVGGESTRPGAAPVAAEDERRRVLPVIEALSRQTSIPISIDTYKADVAAAALDAGAVIVNDVSGLAGDAGMAATVAGRHAALVLMHNRGRSEAMYARAQYGEVVGEVAAELEAGVALAEAAGVARERIVLDPGIGFAKRAEDSLRIVARLDDAVFAALDRPLLLGPSRKSFLRVGLGERPPGEREWGTAAAVTACILAGAHIVRVHGVEAMGQVARVADSILAARQA
jgi:dihydropteroate synthase